MRAKFIMIIFGVLIIRMAVGQQLTGFVYEEDEGGNQVPLVAVNLHWSGTQTGTFTSEEGTFTLDRVRGNNILVVSYAGYSRDSVTVRPGENSISIGLARNIELQRIVITERQASTFLDYYNPIVVQRITGEEFHKAACCNLGESFETNASVDVSYGDAISGAKTIELLGLAGVYSQLMIENIPDYQGFGGTFGLIFIPGHWMEAISLAKGATSVISGNESITGQISVDYKKPDGPEKYYLNLYGNNHGHMEFSTNVSHLINSNLSTMVLAYGGYNDRRIDHNGNGFMDDPLTQRLHLMNRWLYNSTSGNLMAQWGISGLHEDRYGGQMDYNMGEGAESGRYGFEVSTRRYGAFAKGGYMFRSRAATNVAMLNNISFHDQSSLFGLSRHNAEQVSLNHRTIFDTYIVNTHHIVHAGWSYEYHDYRELYNDSIMDRTESIPGLFAQYTYSPETNITFMGGFRADFNSLYGYQWTPRMHVRYQPWEQSTFRLSAGKGYRTMNLFAEHLFLMASARTLQMQDPITPEVAWNFGLHVTQGITVANRPATINAEVFRTNFEMQMIIDMDQDFENIYIYQLDGSSYANNYQIDFTFEPIPRLDVLLAFRYSDSRATINDELVPVAFSKRHRGLINLSYKTRLEKWQFDFTSQFNGTSRLPENKGLPAEHQHGRGTRSPAYTILHAQVTKHFKHWNIYVGGENLTNFVQHNPIIASDDPFGPYFDASQVWGPVLGRKIYVGVRLIFNR